MKLSSMIERLFCHSKRFRYEFTNRVVNAADCVKSTWAPSSCSCSSARGGGGTVAVAAAVSIGSDAVDADGMCGGKRLSLFTSTAALAGESGLNVAGSF